MGMSVGGGGRGKVNSDINTTPLVDVMLVLLIIFLITIPVAVSAIKVHLPRDVNKPRVSNPHNIVVTVDRGGDIYWNDLRMRNLQDFQQRLDKASVSTPQPEVQIRGDSATQYASIGRVLFACQKAGIAKVSFLIQPPVRD